MVSAKSASFINLNAKFPCLPKGGFPTTNTLPLPLNCSLSNLNQSAFTTSTDSGSKSYALIPSICRLNAPPPAEGSITTP